MDEQNQEIHTQQVQDGAGDVSNAQAQPAQPSQPLSDKAQENFKTLRLAKERLEQEKNELAQRLKELEENQQQRYEPDDYVPRQYVDQQIQDQKKQLDQLSMEYRIKMNYPDFDKVVNDQTIETLKQKNPVMAHALGQVTDQYAKATAAYEAIKAFGLYNEDQFAKEREQAQYNANRPLPVQSLAPHKNDSALSYANAFAEGSPEHLSALRREMNQARKVSY